MNEGMSGEQIERVFLALGRIEQKIDSAAELVTKHAAHDEFVQKALFERVENLQLAHAKQKGFFSALATGASILGAGIGYLVEKWLGLGNH